MAELLRAVESSPASPEAARLIAAPVARPQSVEWRAEPIEQIILEEMAAYLDGAIDEKTTAERIQSRVSLYLMEQKVE